jgi:hypothetical protein
MSAVKVSDKDDEDKDKEDNVDKRRTSFYKKSKEKVVVEDGSHGSNIIDKENYKNYFESPARRDTKKTNDETREKCFQWFLKEYTNLWKYKPMSNIGKIEIDKRHSSILRMSVIGNIKLNHLYNTMDTVVIVIKLHDGYLKKETNYGLLFCELEESYRKRISSSQNESHINGIIFTFCSCGPSFISSDGEYRPRFMDFFKLLKVKKQMIDIYSDIEEYVQHICPRRSWSLYQSFFYPRLEVKEKNMFIETAVRREDFAMLLLIITWFQEVYNAYNDLTELHINETYHDIMYREMEMDIKFLEDLIRKYGAEKVEHFQVITSHNYDTARNIHGLTRLSKQGFKMIPLNVKEVQDPLKIRYKPWREIFIAQRASDLVLNAISPGFSIVSDWMYIKNSRKGLFDNVSQYKKMQHSELAKNILHILNEAQRNTYFAKYMVDTMSNDEKRLKEWISTKFKHLDEKINDPIAYCKEEIIMSEVTLGYVSEYVGRTVRDTLNIIENNEIYDAYLGMPFTEEGYHYFAKYIFEICYNLYCLNTKLGVIHGDLHLNNITIGALFHANYRGNNSSSDKKDKEDKEDKEDKKDKEDKEDKEDKKDKEDKDEKSPCVLYVLNDSQQYLFPTTGYYASIIDFSRSIIHCEKYEIFRDSSLPQTYTIVDDADKFKMEEVNYLMNKYISAFPHKYRQKEELIVLFKNYFEAIFRLLTTLDVYVFTIKFLRTIDEIDYPINEKCVELVGRVNKLAEMYITTEVNNLINDPEEYSKKILARDYPIAEIIKKVFSEYNNGLIIKKDMPSIKIVDVFCYENKLEYSLDKYETFPPFLRDVAYEENGKLVQLFEIIEIRKAARIDYETKKLKNLDMMKYIATRHLEKI